MTTRLLDKVMFGTVNAHRGYFETGVADFTQAEAAYPGWLSKLLSHPVAEDRELQGTLAHLVRGEGGDEGVCDYWRGGVRIGDSLSADRQRISGDAVLVMGYPFTRSGCASVDTLSRRGAGARRASLCNRGGDTPQAVLYHRRTSGRYNWLRLAKSV